MFTKPLAEIDKDDIQALADNSEQESATLEFKREIETTDGGKKKLARHVSAMANTTGGVIIFGIEEKASKADKLIGIDAMVGDQPVGEFVNNVLDERVSPRIAIQPQAIKLANDKVALVLRVSKFLDFPHMVAAEHVYYVRRNCRVVRANAHDVSELFQKSKSSSDEVKEFLKKRNLDDKDKENFALTPLSRIMRENHLMVKQIPEGHEGKPFVLFASCPRHLEERIDIASADFSEKLNRSQNFDFFGYGIEFIWHRRAWRRTKSTTADSVRFTSDIPKGDYEKFDEPYDYVEICRNGYVEKGLCSDIMWERENLGFLFQISGFAVDFWAYMIFISQLYKEIGYFDELNIIVALSDIKGINAIALRKDVRNFCEHGLNMSREGIAQEGNVLIERSVVISELGDEQIEEIVKEVVGRVLNHFNTNIEICLDEEGKFDEELLKETVYYMYVH